MPVNAKNAAQLEYSEKIYEELKAAGIDTILDDRKDRAGVKFNDCDLIGYPIRITISPKTIDENTIEVKIRKTGEVYTFNRDEYKDKVCELLKDL